MFWKMRIVHMQFAEISHFRSSNVQVFFHANIQTTLLLTATANLLLLFISQEVIENPDNKMAYK